MCLRMSISLQCLGYVSWLANGLGVLSPLLQTALTPFSAWGRPEFTHVHTGMNTQASYSHGSYVSSSETSSLQHTVSPTWCPFTSLITSTFQTWVCFHFAAFPLMPMNNEEVTRSMWPCKIQHNEASVTDEVITGLLHVIGSMQYQYVCRDRLDSRHTEVRSDMRYEVESSRFAEELVNTGFGPQSSTLIFMMNPSSNSSAEIPNELFSPFNHLILIWLGLRSENKLFEDIILGPVTQLLTLSKLILAALSNKDEPHPTTAMTRPFCKLDTGIWA